MTKKQNDITSPEAIAETIRLIDNWLPNVFNDLPDMSNVKIQENLYMMALQFKALNEKVQKLTEALEFYAEWVDKGIVEEVDGEGNIIKTFFVCPAPLEIDKGEKAKQALKEVKGE